MRTAVLFLLHLCLLLLGQGSHAHAGKTATATSFGQYAALRSHVPAGAAQLLAAAGIPGTGRSSEVFGIDEEEDDELGSRLVVLVRCLLAFSFVFLLGGALPPGPRYRSFYKHFSFLGTNRYLGLRVLRL